MCSSGQENTISSPLLRLPPEIRNKISKYLFESAVIVIHDSLRWPEKHPGQTIKSTGAVAYVQTCGQIRHEARTLYYELSTFDLDELWYLMQ
jgi:hypothetical protein